MSSYQFVNSLAACYNNQRAQESSTGHGDYYVGSNNPVAAYASCYSAAAGVPSQNHPQYPYPASQSSPNSLPHLPNGEHYPSSIQSPSQNRLTHPSGPNPTPSPNTPPSSTVQSCKFAESQASSPQDLSTTSATTPQPAPTSPRGHEATQNPSSTTTSLHSPSATTALPQPLIKAPLSPEMDQAESPLSSPQTPSSPSSGQNNNSKGSPEDDKNFNSSSNPPQIYPWMKRVHIGQSK